MKRLFTVFALLLAFASVAYPQTGTWSGSIKVQGVELPLVFHLTQENPTMDSPDQGAKGIPIQVDRSSSGSISIKIPSIGASYQGLWLVKQIMGTFTQHGNSFPLTLVPGEPKRSRPQTPVAPFPYTTEDVSFANGDAVLKGTLVLPKGCSRKTPVLVMVTGSGLQNRDEELFDHKPFAVIADAFARAGIATLRYDDRGFGESSGDIINCTTEDLKNDALAGIRLLRGRFDRIGVIGHSEGGTIALMLAAEGQADFIVSLSGADFRSRNAALAKPYCTYRGRAPCKNRGHVLLPAGKRVRGESRRKVRPFGRRDGPSGQPETELPSCPPATPDAIYEIFPGNGCPSASE